MYRKIAIAGATAAVIVGAGTAALAVSGSSDTTSGHPASPTQKTGKQRGGAIIKALRHAQHGELVTRGKDSTFVEHDAIVGQVTAVSPTSISVKAADGFSETFTIDKTTKVRKRPTTAATSGAAKAKGVAAKISDVKSGDTVAVVGKRPSTATGNPVATVVIDGVKKR